MKNKEYNLDAAYETIRVDEKKLFKLYDRRKAEDKEELNKIVSYYNRQLSNDFDEEINPRYFTWFHFIPSKARSAFIINRKLLN